MKNLYTRKLPLLQWQEVTRGGGGRPTQLSFWGVRPEGVKMGACRADRRQILGLATDIHQRYQNLRHPDPCMGSSGFSRFACVVDKNQKTPKLSPMADDAITP